MKSFPSAYQPLPDHIKKYAFDFRWDNQLLWKLEVPTTTMGVDKLIWHLDVLWLHTEGERFNLSPTQIMRHPDLYPEQYQRTLHSDLSYPIDIMFNKGNWLILDGLHRLTKAVLNGQKEVRVRKIPRSMIPRIEI